MKGPDNYVWETATSAAYLWRVEKVKGFRFGSVRWGITMGEPQHKTENRHQNVQADSRSTTSGQMDTGGMVCKILTMSLFYHIWNIKYTYLRVLIGGAM